MPGNWQIEWTNEMYHSNDHSVSFTYFSDIQVSYRTKKWEVGIQMNNIFGTINAYVGYNFVLKKKYRKKK